MVIVFVSLLTSCANAGRNEDESASAREVIFDDGHKTEYGNEITISDSDLKGKEELGSIADKSFEETIKTASDGSKITTVFDRYGNKTETRTFNYNSRLTRIILLTSPAGEKQVFVYGQNGEMKALLGDSVDMVLTASPDEIANAAGVYGTRQTTFSVQSLQPLKPLPSNDFPIIKSQTANNLTEKFQPAEQPAASVSETPSNNADTQSKQTHETTTMNEKPDKKLEDKQ